MKTFAITLKNRGPEVEEDEEIERDFQVIKKAHAEVAGAVLGRPRKRKKPWIGEESWNFVDQREEVNNKILGARSERVKRDLRVKYTEKDRNEEEYKNRQKEMGKEHRK